MIRKISAKIKKYHSIMPALIKLSHEKGSILISLIVTMVIIASLGAGMLYITTTSTYQELFANNKASAYYAAESGGNYALAEIRDAYANSASKVATLASNLQKTYNLDSFGSFTIKDYVSNGGNPATVTFTSVGTVGSGLTAVNAQIRYSVQPANQTMNMVTTTYSANQMTNTVKGSFATVTSGTDSGAIKVTSTVDDGNGQWFASAYFNSSVDFVQVRQNQGGFLSYDAQVKVKWNSSVNYASTGLGFRLHPVIMSGVSRPCGFHVDFMRFSTWGNSDGISSWCGDKRRCELKHNSSQWTPGMTIGNYYIILWYDEFQRNEVLLAFKDVTSPMSGSWPPTYATLLVDLEEKNLDGTTVPNGTKANVIKAYYSLPANNPVGTTNWPPATGMNLITWDWIMPNSLESNMIDNADKSVVQTKLYRTAGPTDTLTADCPSNCPNNSTYYNVTSTYDEVGLTAFGAQAAVNNNVFFKDFALRIAGTGGNSSGSGTVIQY